MSFALDTMTKAKLTDVVVLSQKNRQPDEPEETWRRGDTIPAEERNALYWARMPGETPRKGFSWACVPDRDTFNRAWEFLRCPPGTKAGDPYPGEG